MVQYIMEPTLRDFVHARPSDRLLMLLISITSRRFDCGPDFIACDEPANKMASIATKTPGGRGI